MPLLRHAGVVGVLVALFTVVGLLLRFFEWLFPALAAEAKILRNVDFWLVAALFSLFAVYTVLIVVIRLWHGLKREIASSSNSGSADISRGKPQ
jgi:hypothetical protein